MLVRQLRHFSSRFQPMRLVQGKDVKILCHGVPDPRRKLFLIGQSDSTKLFKTFLSKFFSFQKMMRADDIDRETQPGKDFWFFWNDLNFWPEFNWESSVGLFDPDSFKTEINENFQLMNYPNPESIHRDSSPPNTPTQNITDRATPMEDNVKRKIRVFFSIFYILNIFSRNCITTRDVWSSSK